MGTTAGQDAATEQAIAAIREATAHAAVHTDWMGLYGHSIAAW